MTTCAEWRTMLAAAQADLQKALTGGGAVKALRMGEKSIEYAGASLTEKRANVAYLQRKVDACDGKCRGRAISFMPLDC